MRLRFLVIPLLALLLAPAYGQALERRAAPTQGSLLAKGPEDQLLDMPLEHTDVRAEVSGAVARVTVRQTFKNPFEEPIEAIYVSPLPHEAVVTDMLIVVGDRRIRGLVKPREEAKRIYEEAKAAGKTAGLLEQERPNIFTQSLANLLPGESIEVEIRYVERLKHRGNRYSLVFPMVVGPRYIPRNVKDAEKISPPPLKPGERTGHDISLSVEIRGGLPLHSLVSESHETWVAEHEDGGATVTIAKKDAIPNKDFLLSWSLAAEVPEAAVLAHRGEVGGYFTLRVEPPQEVPADFILPRELVFVVDCSGSMRGMPIETAKAVIRRCLSEMNPDDTFRILKFSQRASSFSPMALPNTPDTVQRGLAYVDMMAGSGGTRMLEGVKAALSGEPGEGRMRLVFFLTDGFIGNEREVLAAIQEKLAGARIFPLGVGSSVNRFLIEEMALAGRGVPRFVRHDAKPEKIDEEVDLFYERVAKPLLTDLEVDWHGLPVADLYPPRIPDLFAGQPVSLVGRYTGAGAAEVVLRGNLGGSPWEKTIAVELPEAEERNGVLAPLWARARIGDLSRKLRKGEDEAVKKEITNLAIEFHLMSRFTSFVAVDERVVVQPDGSRRTVRQPIPIPEGTEFEGFGLSTDTGQKGKSMRRSRGGGGARKPPARPAPSGGSSGAPGPGGPAAGDRYKKREETLGRASPAELLKLQKDDGTFGPVSETAVACLALTGWEVTPGKGDEGKALAKALTTLVEALDREDLTKRDFALAALAISEGHTWSGDAKLRAAVEKLVKAIAAERESWGTEAELFSLAALRSAGRVRIRVPAGAVAAGLRRVGEKGKGVHLLVAAYLAGAKLPAEAGEILKATLAAPKTPLDWYLGTIAARAVGGTALKEWTEAARKALPAMTKGPRAEFELTRGAVSGWYRVAMIDW
ncbi:MAG: VIT and vWA domain-containing protein [Planctomycetota bacterium]|jgi:Ca-activated chloride channel family protein